MEEWDESYSYYHYQRPERAGGGWITGGVFVDFVITCLFLFLIVYFTYNYVIQSYQRYRVFQLHPPVPASTGTSRLGPQSLPPLSDASLSERRGGGGLGLGIDGAVGSKLSGDPEVQRLRRELEEKNALLTSMQRMAQQAQSSASTHMMIPSHQHQQQQPQDVQQQQGHFFQGASFFGFGNGSPPRSAAARALFSQVFSQKQPTIDGFINGMATPQYMAPQFAPSQADANPNPFLAQQPHQQQVSATPFPTNVSAPFSVGGGQPSFGNPQLNPAAAQLPPNPFAATAPRNLADAFGGSNMNTAGVPNSNSNTNNPFRGSVFPSDGFVNGAQFRPTEQQNAALFSQHQPGGVAGFSQVGTGFTPQERNTLFGTPQPQAGQLCPSNQINTANNHNPNNNPFGQADLNRQFFSEIDQQTRPTELHNGDTNGGMGGEPHPRTHFSPVGVPTFGVGGATRRSGATGRTDSPGGRVFELPADVNNKKGVAMSFDFSKQRPPLSSQGRQMTGTQRLSDVAGHPTMNHRTPVGRATGVDGRLAF